MSRITLGVTGGVAAYKAAELTRLLQQRGHDVHVVLTRAATEFIQPLTFAALTGHKVHTGLWDDTTNTANSGIEHIDLAQQTGLLLVAPATAHTIARFAQGLADDFLSTLYLATTAPVVLAPAMNVNMLHHPATQANLKTLEDRGVHTVSPAAGYLACGMTGEGRLADLTTIADAAERALNPNRDLAGETVIITAGGTREPLDPVRFLGNRSSGKMGYALAEAALSRGARVILISAPTALTPPSGCEFVPIVEASGMHRAVLTHLPRATILIAAAAVADFRPATLASEKIKRSGPLHLTLVPTEDIVAAASAHARPGTRIVAFAAETTLDLASARAKLTRKGADAIVLNDISLPGLGFDADRNAAQWITPETQLDLPESTKRQLADRILDQTLSLPVPSNPHLAEKA
ncbi:Phosphopantothenate-cysteine ligase /Phosphopantothenoylcysteine decarboxylase [Granulicella pectinivorans]|uniref:Coenzyme A biosynthesis bifunctional protein CoaBC n=1 Tax=Granulicella pectinivorans TaxID=474950 RepID=A0A1I6L8S5_9BACT|nr:bifunctional phosphopantothenoylcysteine decarboxylase/phosphopantothenate--cysteine ligase CoaBC [Granulicella pectinivorans]SFR99847.1 Phosphopantothenate-cysteine ligase /Phosphopantothenoylcysteine decarboxylase [Granulicella pectinivorans]